MKKHFCRPMKPGRMYKLSLDSSDTKIKVAACDELLDVPYHSRSNRNKRLTAEEIVKQMHRPDVCKACIRIVVVERLSGIRPEPEHMSLNEFAKLMSLSGVSTKKAASALSRLTKAIQPLGTGCLRNSIVPIAKDYARKQHIIGEVTA